MQQYLIIAIWVLAFPLGIFSTLPALADDLADAKAAYQQALISFDKGEFDVALAQFTEAYNLSGKPAILYNLAVCEEKLGETEHAIAYYELYLEELPNADDAQKVREKVTQLQNPETTPAKTESEVQETQTTDDANAGAVVPTKDDKASENDGPLKIVAPPDPRAHRKYVLQGFLIGGGSLFLVTGTLTGISAYQNHKDYKEICAPNCSDDKVNKVKRLSLAADIQFGIGIAAIAGGIIWKLVERRKKRALDARSQFSLFPLVSPSENGLALVRRF